MEATLELRFQTLQEKTERETRGVSPEQWRDIQATLRSRGAGCAVGAMACGGCPFVRQCQSVPEPPAEIHIPTAKVESIAPRIGAYAWSALEALHVSSSNCHHHTLRRNCAKCSPGGNKKTSAAAEAK